MRHLVRESAREAFRAGVLASAEKVFTRAGFQDAKMADIAREAGVAVGTLYNYFDSKEEIFQELIGCTRDKFQEHLQPVLALADPMERLRGLVRVIMAHVEERGAIFALFLELGGITELDIQRVGGEHAHRSYLEMLDLMSDAVTACVKDGRLRSDLSPTTMVAALSGSMNAMIYTWLRKGRRQRLSAAADELFTLFLTGASK